MADHHQDDGSRPPAKRARRNSASASSRGVANLTPEQLARKRANDREAQRAIRERTKNQIDRLNLRIQELESQQPYNDLQVVLRQKEAIQAENEDIRRRLASVLAIIQPILGAQGLNELAAAAERSPLALQSEPHPPQHLHPPETRAYHGSVSSLPDAAQGHAQSDVQSPDSQTGMNRQWQFPVAPTSHVRGWPSAATPYEQQQNSIQPDLQGYSHCDERLGVNFLLDSTQHGAKLNHASTSEPTDPALQPSRAGLSRSPPAAYAALPRTVGPTCPLDSVLLDFLADRQVQAADGLPSKALVGPAYPNFAPLVNLGSAAPSHPLSQIFTDILATFPDISTLPEQVAVHYIMFLVMRWQVEPSRENYERLPEWMTPRPSQLFTPHPAWMDYLPWPRLRDLMVQSSSPVPFEAFFIPYTTTVSLNWPYEPRDCLLPAAPSPAAATHRGSGDAGEEPQSPTQMVAEAEAEAEPEPEPEPGRGEQWMINPAFESHLRNLGNWSLGRAFRDVFPELADVVRIREGR